MDALAGLGISKVRYPILWEFHEKEKGFNIDWGWTSERLERLRNSNVDPICTLLHHGSGPRFTNLLDDNFPFFLAEYAGKVAKQFPWINYYTPVNEPLTTARFSGLYGFWFPHKSNDVSFIKMLLNELKGVVLSMKEIRKYNPKAQLIQTEDLGKTYSTPQLQYQANFENHRRWLTYDLLTGRLKREDPMWQYLSRLGIPESDIQFFIDNPCPPDVMGMNYYVTSERFLDHDHEKYDTHTHGSNDLQTYADVEAVRVPHEQKTGLESLMEEAWERYHIPLAITEAHLNCGREEQLRWIKEKWENCCALNEKGIIVKGYTIWSLFGAYGWNRLLLTEDKDYETGAFDVRSGRARPTALAGLIKSLTNSGSFGHPVTEVPGWWKRNIRFLDSFGISDQSLKQMNINPSPILIFGRTGTLGRAFKRACSFRKINFVLLDRNSVDITNKKQIEEAITKYKPWGIINAAGFVRVDDAEDEKERCFNENSFAVETIAACCKDTGIQFMSFSSDLVFDGSSNTPYLEDGNLNPLNNYGLSKMIAEQRSFAANPNTLMIRTSNFFSPYDPYNFVYNVIEELSNGREFKAANDLRFSPTYVPDLVNACLDLFIDNEKGIWHLSTGEDWSYYQMAIKVAEVAGLRTSLIKEVSIEDLNYKAVRPRYSVLGTSNGILLPGFTDGLNRYIQEREKLSRVLQHK